MLWSCGTTTASSTTTNNNTMMTVAIYYCDFYIFLDLKLIVPTWLKPLNNNHDFAALIMELALMSMSVSPSFIHRPLSCLSLSLSSNPAIEGRRPST